MPACFVFYIVIAVIRFSNFFLRCTQRTSDDGYRKIPNPILKLQDAIIDSANIILKLQEPFPQPARYLQKAGITCN